MSDLDGLRNLYLKTAPFYEQYITPVLQPLASDLASWIVRCACARLNYELYDAFDVEEISPKDLQQLKRLNVIDVGTGTSTLARVLAPEVGTIIGLDLSAPMLNVARQTANSSLHLVQADLHQMPLRRGAVQLAVSSFGLNASTPKQSLRSIRDLLRRGEGMIAFQEWGAEDDCSRILDETLGEFSPDDVPEIDPAMSNFFDAPKPWYDQLQDADDYYAMLKDTIGFDLVWAKESAFTTVHLPDVDTFIAYKLAWASRRFTIAAMTDDMRGAFNHALHERLHPFVNPDGSFDWSPALFRVFATR